MPVSAIKRKIPDIGTTSAEESKVGKMAFALITKAGKKMNVNRIEFNAD